MLTVWWPASIDAASSVLSVKWRCARAPGCRALGRTLVTPEGSHRAGVQLQLWDLQCTGLCGVRPLVAQ